MAPADPVNQLRVLNEVLTRAAGTSPENAAHARRALDFFSSEERAGNQPAVEVCLRRADTLARIHFGDSGADIGFAHWHVPALEDFSPLWIRQAIVAEMKKLAGRRAALLLVTGLRDAVCPPGRYWTKSRQAEYDRVRDWIDELACAWATRGSRLQVVVL